MGQLKNGNEHYKGGRPSRLADPSFLKLVAESFASGMSRQEMCDVLKVKDKDTITRWRKDPRVKALVARLNEDRVIQISRKVDSIIEGRLSHADDMDTETLIKIRKEYGGAAVARTEKADDNTISDALELLEKDPAVAEKLRAVLRGEEAPEPATQ